LKEHAVISILIFINNEILVRYTLASRESALIRGYIIFRIIFVLYSNNIINNNFNKTKHIYQVSIFMWPHLKISHYLRVLLNTIILLLFFYAIIIFRSFECYEIQSGAQWRKDADYITYALLKKIINITKKRTKC